MPDGIANILAAIQEKIGFDAAGIRLRQGEGFSYFAQRGFSNKHLATENTLTTLNENGAICRNPDGSVMLECTCGLVLRGKTVPNHPMFTPRGSFWSNDTQSLLDLSPEQDPRWHPRKLPVVTTRAGDGHG